MGVMFTLFTHDLPNLETRIEKSLDYCILNFGKSLQHEVRWLTEGLVNIGPTLCLSDQLFSMKVRVVVP